MKEHFYHFLFTGSIVMAVLCYLQLFYAYVSPLLSILVSPLFIASSIFSFRRYMKEHDIRLLERGFSRIYTRKFSSLKGTSAIVLYVLCIINATLMFSLVIHDMMRLSDSPPFAFVSPGMFMGLGAMTCLNHYLYDHDRKLLPEEEIAE